MAKTGEAIFSRPNCVANHRHFMASNGECLKVISQLTSFLWSWSKRKVFLEREFAWKNQFKQPVIMCEWFEIFEINSWIKIGRRMQKAEERTEVKAWNPSWMAEEDDYLVGLGWWLEFKLKQPKTFSMAAFYRLLEVAQKIRHILADCLAV